MTSQLPSLCDSCVHRRTPTTCDAFPRGIPEAIVTWGGLHVDPLPDQGNDVVWAFKRGTREEYEDWRRVVESEVQSTG